jgi:hypothetical protein
MTFDLPNPATGEILARVAEGGAGNCVVLKPADVRR